MNRKMNVWVLILVVLFAGAMAPVMAQQTKSDRFWSVDECLKAIEDDNYIVYHPSNRRGHRQTKQGESVDHVEAPGCFDMEITANRNHPIVRGNRAWVVQDEKVEMIFRDGRVVARWDCGNAVHGERYPTPPPSPPAPEPKPEPPPPPQPAPKPEPPPPPVVLRPEPPARVVLPKRESLSPAPKPAPVVKRGGHGKLVGGVAVVGVAALVAILATRGDDSSPPPPAPVGFKPGVPVISPASRPGGAGFAIRF